MCDSKMTKSTRRGHALLPLVWLLACCGFGGFLLLGGSKAASPQEVGSGVPPGGRLMPIEQVRPGQRVWAYDPAVDRWRSCEVVEAYERDYQGDMIAIGAAGGEPVLATGNHPFWVEGGTDLAGRPPVEELAEQEMRGRPGRSGRWVAARHLREHDVLVRADGSRATVTSLSSWHASTPVYNLKVAELHTYAVGELALAAHNNGPCGGNGGGGKDGGKSGGEPNLPKVAQETIDRYRADIDYIDKHGSVPPRFDWNGPPEKARELLEQQIAEIIRRGGL